MEENVPIETVPAPDVEEAWPLPPAALLASRPEASLFCVG